MVQIAVNAANHFFKGSTDVFSCMREAEGESHPMWLRKDVFDLSDEEEEEEAEGMEIDPIPTPEGVGVTREVLDALSGCAHSLVPFLSAHEVGCSDCGKSRRTMAVCELCESYFCTPCQSSSRTFVFFSRGDRALVLRSDHTWSPCVIAAITSTCYVTLIDGSRQYKPIPITKSHTHLKAQLPDDPFQYC
eukprot:TRINITY_DN2915_c1_g1_i1.p1 TRINITY_DN2915_c1_g1~~TRINITY_DN2915_c1_g1_i1.p1  ORF type:complete len:209 (+),score=36.46 TRINITY_DN2915_c1_g1_i1:60-629(+)